MYNHQLTKSHWGNTQLGQTTSLGGGNLESKTPASDCTKSFKPSGEMTCSSGYMADNSSARTPGTFLGINNKQQDSENKPRGITRENVSTPHADEKRQKLGQNISKYVQQESDDDDEEEEFDDFEPTGCIGEMVNQFRKKKDDGKLGVPTFKPLNNVSNLRSSYLQESLKESFLEKSRTFAHDKSKMSFAELCREEASMMAMPQMDISGPAFTSMQSLNKPDYNDETNAPVPEESMNVPEMEESALQEAQTPNADLSITISNLNLDDLEDVTDPFDEELQIKLLSKLSFPVSKRHGYVRIHQNLPQFRSSRTINVGKNSFLIGQCKGEGSYGKVYQAMKNNPENFNETIANMDVVLKIQKPACEWEFYICTEIHRRLNSEDSPQRYHDWFMSIPRCFTYDDGSVFVSEHHQGTLLDLINKDLKLVNMLAYESIAMYFVIELLIIFEKLKDLDIIHGDVKADNFLVQRP